MYRAVARQNKAEPDAGRHLASWAAEAGFEAEALAPLGGDESLGR